MAGEIVFAKQPILKMPTKASSSVPVSATDTLNLFIDSTSLKISSKNSAGTVVNPTEVKRNIVLRAIDKTVDWPADGTTNIWGDFECPFTGTILSVFANVDTAGITGTSVVDILKNGTTIMSTTKLQWDSSEKSTRTFSGTAATITTSSVTEGDIITISIITNHTTKSKGLCVTLIILPS